MADKPITREEKYLAYLTGDYTGELPKPITRKEKYLYELCLKGIGGEISPEEIKNAVTKWLDDHPEATTTVQDESIEEIKINKNFLPWIKKDYITPKMFGAKGDGITDDTESIQYALNEAEKTGKTVFIPDGNYVIKSLTIPKAVSIVGENNNFGTNRIGTAFYCTDRNNPAILMNSYSSIDNIAFYYPNQRVVNNYAVTYPETIALTDAEITTLIKIRNIFLVNAYYGINATPKHEKMLIEKCVGVLHS